MANNKMRLDLNGCTLTLVDLERIVSTLETEGRIEIVNCRKDLGGATLLRLGAYLAENSKLAVLDKNKRRVK